jgi:hypothetical protein
MTRLSLLPTIKTAAIIILSTATVSTAGVNVQINGYLPAPPGVHIQLDAGRPYYIEGERRVYIEKDTKHHKKKHKGHRGHEYRDHDDNGRHNGHGKHNKHD